LKRAARVHRADEATAPVSETIANALRGTGLIYRGGFHPRPEDEVPSLADGGAVGTVILIGNAGPELWHAFCEAVSDRAPPHPLDRWIDPILTRLADELSGTLVWPNRGPEFPPIQAWAMRAEPVTRSPIGILIHPDFGLWHVYRAALLFKDRLALPPRDDAPSPCDSCVSKPCLKVCPGDAFKPDRFDALACVGHVESAAGANCRQRGCLARRACPVGRAYAYPADAGAFHMAAVVRAVRAGYGAA
jgi:ferredoxin